VPPVYAAILSFRPPVSTHEAALEIRQELVLSRGTGTHRVSLSGDQRSVLSKDQIQDSSCRKTRGTCDLSCQEDKALPARAQGTRPVRGQETSPVRDEERPLSRGICLQCPFRITTVRPASDCLVEVTGTRTVLPLHVEVAAPCLCMAAPRIITVSERVAAADRIIQNPSSPSLCALSCPM
jgi:hypothetical protein